MSTPHNTNTYFRICFQCFSLLRSPLTDTQNNRKYYLPHLISVGFRCSVPLKNTRKLSTPHNKMLFSIFVFNGFCCSAPLHRNTELSAPHNKTTKLNKLSMIIISMLQSAIRAPLSPAALFRHTRHAQPMRGSTNSDGLAVYKFWPCAYHIFAWPPLLATKFPMSFSVIRMSKQ